MKVIGDTASNDCMAGISLLYVSISALCFQGGAREAPIWLEQRYDGLTNPSCCSSTDMGRCAKDIHQLAFPYKLALARGTPQRIR